MLQKHYHDVLAYFYRFFIKITYYLLHIVPSIYAGFQNHVKTLYALHPDSDCLNQEQLWNFNKW